MNSAFTGESRSLLVNSHDLLVNSTLLLVNSRDLLVNSVIIFNWFICSHKLYRY
ncbi:hypothetical protein H7T43_21845 [Peribacillus simplex]|nr:hypothetical protein [Peribacillus simplex]